ncbi:hypothetical protein [Solidesulfovibrio sp.]|uniref:hypothetical protein n=1 Tax=Solidesulfovibrio sp. TaxID=2910990 RepID=UPI0026269D50|nr:hypothetical protein [Solidesulfovibrio sp.]
MNGDRWHHCLRCGHVGPRPALDEGQPEAPVCACCGSFEIEPCAAPAGGRLVAWRALLSAEAQVLYWLGKAEKLSSLIARAASDGAMAADYVNEARRIQTII